MKSKTPEWKDRDFRGLNGPFIQITPDFSVFIEKHGNKPYDGYLMQGSGHRILQRYCFAGGCNMELAKVTALKSAYGHIYEHYLKHQAAVSALRSLLGVQGDDGAANEQGGTI